MKTMIKIHDTQWFREHCSIVEKSDLFCMVLPRYFYKVPETVEWLSGNRFTMSPLEGKVLEVQYDIGNKFGIMNKARYRVDGFWIPNWAIEWVKEVQE